MHFSTPILCCLAVLTSPILAHPGHDLSQEIKERATFIEATKRSDLSHCAAKIKERGLEKRNAVRRSATVKSSMQKRGLKKRDLSTVLAASHNETSAGYTSNTSEDTLFSGNNSCILTPEVTQGPYYVAGEYYRRDVRDSQEGVDLVIDTQVIDVDTCEPVPDVHIEIWHCNSTGVYSGIVASGNGVGSSDPSNVNATFLRGVQTTDSDGVAQFETVFPGHYTGRATHVHVMVHMNGTVRANNTWSGAVAAHVGQMFFDQTLISQVEAVTPYSTNTQTVTENADDSILSSETGNDVDPMMEYTLLGDTIEDGLFAWLAFGINTTYATTITPAATLYASGGVENTSSGGPGGNGTIGNGTFPSGAGFNSSSLPPTSTAV